MGPRACYPGSRRNGPRHHEDDHNHSRAVLAERDKVLAGEGRALAGGCAGIATDLCLLIVCMSLG